MSQDDITILSGNPTPEEIAALTALLNELDARAREDAAQVHVPRDRWGTEDDQYNPSAHLNVRYY
ncbi:acyl-CoA carboxylase subunit epsilon [Corynebacterium lizhenjunii]|uniref:Acyl-CoA carboxylase subunit epsilon n=1 Tax=Corynebacterium lizhenjunii TaxID=2709394 RepID=A0A7T0PD52_9CORY|nr:acyl-CoA carboxylase subunit epsilon [Corynebacterium lizhenjunii]